MKEVMGVQDEEADQSRKEIANMWKVLCHKLDALSNFHHQPKPVRVLLRSAWFESQLSEGRRDVLDSPDAISPRRSAR